MEVEIEDCATLVERVRRDHPQHSTSYHHFLENEVTSIRRLLLSWYDSEHRWLPWRCLQPEHSCTKARPQAFPALQMRDVGYAVWVSEIMLQQTRVATVMDYFVKWMQRWPTIEDLASASLEDVNAQWAGLGYYRRARLLHEGAKMVMETYKGKLPQTYEQLRKIPGIGDYTAGAVSSIAFGKRVPAVDGNVIRVTSRLRAVRYAANSSNATSMARKNAGDLVDEKRPGDFNQAVMELGATICTSTSPLCGECPVQSVCLAYAESSLSKEASPSPSQTFSRFKLKRQEEPEVMVIDDSSGSEENSKDEMETTTKEETTVLKEELSSDEKREKENTNTFGSEKGEMNTLVDDEAGRSSKDEFCAKGSESSAKASSPKEKTISTGTEETCDMVAEETTDARKGKSGCARAKPDKTRNVKGGLTGDCAVCQDEKRLAMSVTEYPLKAQKKAATDQHIAVAIITRIAANGEEVLLQRRPNKGLLAGLWLFPNVIITDGKSATAATSAVRSAIEGCGYNTCTLSHSHLAKRRLSGEGAFQFTHINQTMSVYHIPEELLCEATSKGVAGAKPTRGKNLMRRKKSDNGSSGCDSDELSIISDHSEADDLPKQKKRKSDKKSTIQEAEPVKWELCSSIEDAGLPAAALRAYAVFDPSVSSNPRTNNKLNGNGSKKKRQSGDHALNKTGDDESRDLKRLRSEAGSASRQKRTGSGGSHSKQTTVKMNTLQSFFIKK